MRTRSDLDIAELRSALAAATVRNGAAHPQHLRVSERAFGDLQLPSGPIQLAPKCDHLDSFGWARPSCLDVSAELLGFMGSHRLGG